MKAREEARWRIAEAKQNQAPILDLGDLQLEVLPAELGELTHLRVLALGQLAVSVEDGKIDWRWDDQRSAPRWKNLAALARLTNLENLDLTNCTELVDIRPLSALSNLQRLNLASCAMLTDVQPLAALTNLRSLTLLSCRELLDISPLGSLGNLESLVLDSCSRLTDIQPLSALANLRSLSLTACVGLEDFRPLASLTNLDALDLGNCSSLADVAPLAALANLRDLTLSCCSHLTNVEPLAALGNLRCLVLWACEGLTDVLPLAALTNLQSLYLQDCPNIDRFAPLLPLLSHLKSLFLFGSSFADLPVEICGESDHDNVLDVVRAHFADLASGPASDTEVKVFVLGNGGVGKTQLCRRLRHQSYDPAVPTTHGVQLGHLDVTVADSPVRLNLWDFGGQDIYHGSHALFLQGQAVFLLLWTPRHEQGEYQEAGLTLRHRPLAYWLDYIRGLAGTDCPVLLIQSQCDTPGDRSPLPLPVPVDFTNFQQLQVSASTGRGLPLLRATLEQAVGDLLERHPPPPIGQGRLEVRNRLREMLEADQQLPPEQRQYRTLTHAQFHDLCRQTSTGKVCNADALLQFLHRQGVLFHRSGLFQDRIILDQTWALKAIYALFHRGRTLPWLVSHGRFTRQDLEAWIWHHHTADEQRIFLAMMESCGICFRAARLPASNQADEWEYIAPELLPPRQRLGLTDRIPRQPPSARIEIPFRFLHDGILRTFLSHVGEHAGDTAVYWKFGCYLYDEETDTKVVIDSRQEEAGHPGLGRITFEAWGTHARQFLRSLVRILRHMPLAHPPAIPAEYLEEEGEGIEDWPSPQQEQASSAGQVSASGAGQEEARRERVPPPDMILWITRHSATRELCLALQEEGGVQYRTFRPIRFNTDPAAYAAELFRSMTSLVHGVDPAQEAHPEVYRPTNLDAEEIDDQIRAKLQSLWTNLVPADFRQLYEAQRHAWRDRSLLVVSDEPNLPWELLWPHGAGWQDEGPWCCTSRLTRWLRNDHNRVPGPPSHLPMRSLAVLAPTGTGLAGAHKEKRQLLELAEEFGISDRSPATATLAVVKGLLRQGNYDWLHIATHGNFHKDSPDHLATVWLQGGKPLTPETFIGPDIAGHIQAVRPGFFLNACELGQQGWGLTGLAGWAAALLGAGAGLFAGSLWEIRDDSALEFVRAFYQRVLSGATVGEAFRHARLAIRKSGDPTWLAYTLYAHPNAVVLRPGEPGA